MHYFGDHGRDLATLTHRYEHSTRRRKKKENFNRKTIPNTVLIGSRNASDYGIGGYVCQELLDNDGDGVG